ncbi:epoxide hydrolase family protein [Amycolatopsis sp. lyj-108]|uniref:epoxide hydrolase family protein n=1 Tax=Amycolatopsis sp. lyj-108 TaxID=2789286 RepID=UPI003978D5E0
MRPFQIAVAQDELDEMGRRIADTRWPSEIADAGWERGVPLDYLRDLADYWRTGFDWRAVERRLNEFDQYVTTIDGAQVHFLHVRSPETDALPLVLTHGWPGSVAEFAEVIPRLTDPRAYGGEAADAFHVVVPSIPGFGFSGRTEDAGWNARRVAGAWAELMRELGYDRYGAHGGDAGSVISLELGKLRSVDPVGIHLTMLLTFPSGAPGELADLSAVDRERLGRLKRFDEELSGYMKLQSTKPQTLAYALTDSPVGQLAWIAERYHDWTGEQPLDPDILLTAATIYWLTATAGSSAHHYYESAADLRGVGQESALITTPVGVAVFGEDILPPIRRLAERDLPTIVHWSEFERGGHFPALEQPDEFVADVRRFFSRLR